MQLDTTMFTKNSLLAHKNTNLNGVNGQKNALSGNFPHFNALCCR